GGQAFAINYTGGDGNDVTLTTVTPADVGVVKSGPSAVVAGTSATYTITVTNNGPGTAQNVVVSDAGPAGCAFLSPSTASLTLALGFSVITFAAASMAPGTSATGLITVLVTPNSLGTVSNTAPVTAATPETNTANNSSTSTATI